MAGEGRLYGYLGCFKVSCFSYHNDVRVLPYNVPERVRKIQAYLRLDLYLVDSLELVFYRIFNSNDLFVRGVDLVQGAVKCCGLAAPGRSGHQDYAVRLGDQLLKSVKRFREETETLKVDDNTLFVKDPHHHAFTVQHRYGGYAQVDFFFSDFKPYAAVLRQSPLGNIQLCRELYSRCDGCLQPFGYRLYIMKYAVDAVPDFQFILKRFDVYIAGPVFNGPYNHHVDQFDYRRLGGEVFKMTDVLLIIFEELKSALVADLLDKPVN